MVCGLTFKAPFDRGSVKWQTGQVPKVCTNAGACRADGSVTIAADVGGNRSDVRADRWLLDNAGTCQIEFEFVIGGTAQDSSNQAFLKIC